MAEDKDTNGQTARTELEAAFDEADDKIIDEELDAIESEGGPEEEEDEDDEDSQEIDEDDEGSLDEEEDFEETLEAEEEEVEETPISPPVSWSAEDKELFRALPRKAQETVLRRESQRDSYLTEKAKEIEQLKREYASLDEVVSPYKQNWDLQGVSKADAIRQAIAMRQELLNDPTAFVRWVKSQVPNLDLSKVEQTATPIDPQVQALNGQVQALNAQLSQQQEAALRRQHELLTQEVVAFAQETDGKGQPLRPFFEEVSETMQGYAEAIKARNPHLTTKEILDRSYKLAVKDNPLVAEKEESFKREMVRKSQEAEKRKKVQRAKKAAKSVRGSPGKASEEAKQSSVRDTLLAAFEQYAT